jgi:hypothetical protein
VREGGQKEETKQTAAVKRIQTQEQKSQSRAKMYKLTKLNIARKHVNLAEPGNREEPLQEGGNQARVQMATPRGYWRGH